MKLWLSVETEGYAAFPADTCITESSKGQWLAADVWKFLDPASVDPASLPPISEEYYNEYRKDAKGFVMFHDSANAAGDLVTWRIFDNEEDADAAEIKSANQWTGPAVELIINSHGIIGFDYLCAAGSLPDMPTEPTTAPSAAFSTGTSGSVTISVATLAMVLWNAF